MHPEAILIGDVFVLQGAFVAPLATMRGDFGRLILGVGANLQEHCCMHGFPETDTIVEENGHIGHGSILHGCVIGENTLIGMNSTILDNAVIGNNVIIGANSLVTAGTEIESDSLAFGSPAKVVRSLNHQEKRWKYSGTKQYQILSDIYPKTLVKTVADSDVDWERPRMNMSNFQQKPH